MCTASCFSTFFLCLIVTICTVLSVTSHYRQWILYIAGNGGVHCRHSWFFPGKNILSRHHIGTQGWHKSSMFDQKYWYQSNICSYWRGSDGYNWTTLRNVVLNNKGYDNGSNYVHGKIACYENTSVPRVSTRLNAQDKNNQDKPHDTMPTKYLQ